MWSKTPGEKIMGKVQFSCGSKKNRAKERPPSGRMMVNIDRIKREEAGLWGVGLV